MLNKKIIFIGILVFFMIFLLKPVSSQWCYQESTNTTNQSSTGTGGNPSGDGSCGLSYTGSYSTSGSWFTTLYNLYDGNWDSYNGVFSNNASFYINYTKPTGALNSSLWKVKDIDSIKNLTIPFDCWNYSNSNTNFRVIAFSNFVYYYCKNITNWKLISNISGARFYEEAMWWDISAPSDTSYPQFSNYWDNNATQYKGGTGLFNVTVTSTNGTVWLTFNNTIYYATNTSGNATTFNVTITNILLNGTYSYNWSSYGNGTSHNFNSSGTKSYTILDDITPPNIQILYPSNNTNTTNKNINVNYTSSDNVGLSSCWYSNSSGAVNYTLASCTTNITGVTWLEGINNITIWANDTSNNINSSSITFFIDTTPPLINFISQVPADINTLNAYSTWTNITYNVTDATTGVNSSSVVFYYKTNSSIDDISFYTNGTPFSGYNTHVGTNQGVNWTNLLDDNNIYPGKFNLNQTIMEDTTHAISSLGVSNVVKIEFLNVSNSTQYNIFEFMANSTATTSSLFVFYCNSSYVSGSVLTNANCIQFGSLTGRTTFNITNPGLNSSKYQIMALNINTTSGKALNSIQVTPTSYLILRKGFGPGSWSVYNVALESRTTATQTSTNNGITWSTQTYTVDSHLHQYVGTDTFYYHLCANDTIGNGNCSLDRSDLLEQGGMPPSVPHVYVPDFANYSGYINISYLASISPNGYAISFYNISLLNQDESYNKTIISNNSLNLNYSWNTVGTPDGSYFVKVVATDNISQTSFDLSENFTIDNTPPYFTNLANQSMYTNQSLNYDIDATDLGVGLGSFAINWTNTFSIVASTGVLTNISVLSAGMYYLNVSVNDTLGNLNSSIISINVSIPADTIAPSISILYPTNGTNSSNLNLNVNYTVFDNIALSSCWYSNDTYSVNVTLTNCSTNITTITWSQGNHNVTVWANDTSNNVNSSKVSFTIDSISPVVSILYPPNGTSSSNTNINVNYTVSDSGVGVGSCWYSNDSYSVNTSLASCTTNITGVTWSEGLHNVIVYANDTLNNIGFSSVSFTIDITPPNLTITNPTSHQNFSYNTSINLNYTVADALSQISNVWYNLDNGTNISLGTGIPNTMCYQESANVSTACGGLNTGTYTLAGPGTWTNGGSPVYDGNWSSGDILSGIDSDAYIYINYSIPTNAQNSSLWEVEDFGPVVTNLSLTSCIWSGNILQLRIDSNNQVPPAGAHHTFWDCFNGSSWVQLRSGPSGALGPYEEAMIWNISNTLFSNTTFSTSEGNHNLYLYANDTSNNVNSTFVSFTIDMTPPNFTNLANQSIYNNQSLNYNIDATDSGVGLGSFAINWTNTFSIVSSTGVLTNISSLSVGLYYINVSINDTIGNMNSGIILINVSSSADIIPPVINWVENISAVTLNGGTTKTFYVLFNASDSGSGINVSTANLSVYKTGEITRYASLCNNNTYQNQFNCSVTMQFYDGAGVWSINASISDNSNNQISNSTQTFTVNALDYVSQDNSSISWSSVFSVTNDNEADTPMILTNGGNQDYSNISIKSYNSTGIVEGQVIQAENFSVDALTGQTTGQTYMSDGNYVQPLDLTGLNNHGSSITESIYFYVDVASLKPDTYKSDTNWVIKCSA